jgi:phosphoglycerate dehydrogenase-like enzyme
MLRVGYPYVISPELLGCFPDGVELIPVPERPESEIDLDVWIPDFYPTRAQRAWPYLRGVKLVISLLAGTEWIPGTVGPHVTICNARSAHNVSTAEWTVAAILGLLKYFPFYLEMTREGVWKRRFDASKQYTELTGDTRTFHPPVLQEELAGKTVLLVGYGEIGKQIERLLVPFQVEMVRIARTARSQPEVHAPGELESLLPQADIVVLILPYTPESKGLIGRRQLALLRQGALLVNAARGPIVETDALVEALQSGRIRAALDVTDPEPLPEGHPLWNCPNLLMTPHVAASTPQFTPRALQMAADELKRYMAGEPLRNVVQAAI